jgi:hypothetical protein
MNSRAQNKYSNTKSRDKSYCGWLRSLIFSWGDMLFAAHWVHGHGGEGRELVNQIVARHTQGRVWK